MKPTLCIVVAVLLAGEGVGAFDECDRTSCPLGSICHKGVCALAQCGLLQCQPGDRCSISDEGFATCIAAPQCTGDIVLTPDEQEWCCIHEGSNCQRASRVCIYANEDEVRMWSDVRRLHCCTHHGICFSERHTSPDHPTSPKPDNMIGQTGLACALGASWRCYAVLTLAAGLDMLIFAAGCMSALAVAKKWMSRILGRPCPSTPPPSPSGATHGHIAV